MVRTYTLQGAPLLEIVDLEKVIEAHRSEVRGADSLMRGPSLMDLGPRDGLDSHAPKMSGSGGHPITREPSVPHFPIGNTKPIKSRQLTHGEKPALSYQP